MNIQTQNKISRHIVNDFRKYNVSTMDAIGLLESIKLSLFNDSEGRIMIDICKFFNNGFCIQYSGGCKYRTPEQRCIKIFLNSKHGKLCNSIKKVES